jgi:diguanylate cyclase (GGDEF)-like protein
LRVSTSEVLDYYEQSMGEVLVFRDVTAEKRAEADLRYLATHDSLTDLPNRSLLQDRLDRAVNRSQREDVGFAVIMFDLDDFKRVNDDIDHVVGDAVLKTTARRLAHCVRGLDTVCRLGGDEFLLVVEDLVEVDEADIIARRILRSFEEPMNALGHSITVSGSIGISTYPADSDEPTTLVKMADLALNTAKQAGRGLYRFFSPNMEASNRQRIHIENGLQNAIGKEELYLAYQPLFDFESGSIAGVEALIRWNSPDLGQLAPMEFIPVAERSGLIVVLGEWVLSTACQQNKAWQEAGLPKVPISVNVSARQLREENFAERVVEILGESGLEPNLLEIELTETAVMENLSRSRKILDDLAKAGIRLVIDDFGTGYSSLARLRQLPIEAIKVDRSFIEHIDEDERDLSLVMAIVAMASNLGLQVVAEGVETLDQLRALNGLESMPVPRFHCDRVQGFLFSKPVGGAELARLFTRSESQDEPFRSIRRVLHESAA